MLKSLNRSTVDTTTRPVKVLQFGEGNFLRAFTDWIIDILNDETDFNGSIQIIQPLPQGLGQMINKQDGLYHVLLHGIQQGKAVRETRLITSVRGVINPYEDLQAFLRTAEEPELKFVISNTTEAGICFSANDSDFNKLATTFPGKLTQWLHHRFAKFEGAASKGLIFLPCELIESNGEALNKAISQYATLWNLPAAFMTWVNENSIFCNTLVDRIVPGFPKENAIDLKEELGFDDDLMVKAEPFHLWVIEGPESIKEIFPVHKTDLQVKFTSDLRPYRTRKVRILNGAHTSIVPIAYFKGLRTVQETIENPEVYSILRRIIFDEIIPTLDLSREELENFANAVLERFQNPFIRHELMSIALNSISKFKVRVLPSLTEYYKRSGKLPDELVSSLASLICFYRGEHNGTKINLNDSEDVIKFFQNAWENNPSQLAEKVLSNEQLWGEDLSQLDGIEKVIAEKLRHHLSSAAPL